MNALAGRFALPDSKYIHRVLFGVVYEEDIYETFCRAAPWLMRAFWWRINPEMRRRNLIFVHVPRAAGTSISSSLFGPRNTQHYSARYYETVNPRFFASAVSFAVLRDPFERFASAYAFVRGGGTRTCRLASVFAAETAHIRGVDDYLCYLESRDVLELDFVMRPQAWFVCDLESGAPLVRHLFLLDEDTAALTAFLRCHGVESLPRLNPSERIALMLTRRQKSRIEAIYARDFALVEDLCQQRGRQVADFSRAAAIAAE